MNKLLTSIIVASFISTGMSVGSLQAQIEVVGYSIDGGGGMTAGGPFSVTGAIGQPDAGPESSGGSFTVTGGNNTDNPILLGDLNGDGQVNLLDVTPFVEAVVDGIFVPEADMNQDGQVNLLDVDPFVQLLVGG